MTDERAQALEPDDPVGDGYIVERFLAGGGMGQVYLARDLRLDRQVAIKLLHPGTTGPVAEARFKQEARALSQVVHPNIVGIHAFGRHGDGWYIVMEYVEGRSLGDLLRERGTLELHKAISIARQVASGLAEAHGFGLVHRDIKPDNILLRELASGVTLAKVVDFGLARAMLGTDAVPLTENPGTLGTPAYMAPEQIRGLPVDGRCDLYALAVVVYQMLSGRLPFFRTDVRATLIAHLLEEPPALSSPGVAVSWGKRLERAVLRGLAKEVEERQATVIDFARELEESAGVSRGEQPVDTVVCPACGRDGAEGGGYCAHCGSAVPMGRCAACDTDREGERYSCGSCGAPLLRPARRMHVGRRGVEAAGRLEQVTVAVVLARLAARAGVQGQPALSEAAEIFSAVVEREGGRPLAFVGMDCVAVFGVGGMREREMACAVDAALALQGALGRLAGKESGALGARVGIAIGTVATRGVGVAWGTAYAGGDAVIRAQRAAELAPPGGVCASEVALREVRALYELDEAGGHHRLVLRRCDTARSFSDFALRGVEVPLIAREIEVAQLIRAARAAGDRREGTTAAIIGRAGAGKSRLVGEFLRQVRALGMPHEVSVGRCRPVGLAPAYEPFAEMLARKVQATAADLGSQQALRALPGIDGNDEARAAWQVQALARLLGLEGQDDTARQEEPVRPATAAERLAAFDAFLATIAGAAARQPQVIIIEDLQWARQPTRDLLAHLIRGCAERPVLLLLLMRDEGAGAILDELAPPRARTLTLNLDPLAPEECGRFIATMVRGIALPPALLESVYAFSEGVPARVEEALDALIEARVLTSAHDGWSLDPIRAGDASFDRSFDEMVQRRVGRLPPAERVLLQAAAIAVPPAPHGMLIAMLEREVPQQDLDAAVAAGFLVPARTGRFEGESEYGFRQLSVAEAIAGTVPTRKAREFHRRAAGWLMAWKGRRPAGFGAMVAHHNMVAGDNPEAVASLMRAARGALRAFANRDAYDALCAAVELGSDWYDEHLEDPAARRSLLEALLAKAELGMRIGEPEASLVAARRASVIAREASLWRDEGRAWLVRGDTLRNMGRPEQSLAAGRAAAACVQGRPGATGEAVYARCVIAMAMARLERFEEAEEVALQALALAEAAEQGDGLQEGLARLRTLMGHLLARKGEVGAAFEQYELARAWFRKSGDTFRATVTVLSMGNVAYRRGDLDEAERIYRSVARSCTETDDHRNRAIAETNLGNVLLDRGRSVEALRALRNAEGTVRTLGALDLLPETLRLAALSLLEQGDTLEAGRAASEAAELAREAGNEAMAAAADGIGARARSLHESVSATTLFGAMPKREPPKSEKREES